MAEVKEQLTIPYIVYEATMSRVERHAKRMIIALLLTIILLFISNGLWLYAWMQYDYIGTDSTITVDAKDGTANYIGNDGEIVNGKDNCKEKDTNP